MRAEDGGSLPTFTAGSHIDVALTDSLVRQYSIFNSPLEGDRYCIGVLLSPTSRGGSIAVHRLKLGDKVAISPPKNHFPLVQDGQYSLLIAGGIGITPILSMATQLHESGRPFHLYYSARDHERMAFKDLIESVAWRDNVTLHFSSLGGSRLDLATILANPRQDAHVYVCGPNELIDAVVATADSLGWAGANVHRERFSAEVVHAETDHEFVVELSNSGKRVTVPKNQSIAQALRSNGVAVPTSCEQGLCGTCLTGLKGGVADHRDEYLTDEEKREGKQILLCCSRAISDTLILDM
nr:PDR/VanB family oxidoreductase [Burkholderia sp. Ac-20353]